MTFKDKITIVISVVALSVSVLSLYVTQFRATYLAEAVVLRSDALGGTLSYQVAIMNQGTHRVVITDAVLRAKGLSGNN